MTSEEIKRNYSMPEIVRKYGIEINNQGMCRCPWHGKDRHPSMKIYKDSFFCFTCEATGDIFTFIQRMDGSDFKTVFLALGGTYQEYKDERQKRIAKVKLKAEKAERQIKPVNTPPTGGKLFKALTETIDLCKSLKDNEEVFSDKWCEAVNQLPYLEYLYQEIFCKEQDVTDGLYIYQQCRSIKRRLNT